MEPQFYLLWPLILIATWKWKGKRGALTVALWGLALSIGDTFGVAWFGTTVGRVYFASDTRAVQLLAGCGVALLAQCRWLPHIPRLASVSALAAILVIALVPLPLIYQMTATALFGAVLVAGLSQHDLRPLNFPAARWLGQRSYAIYLWHPFVGVVLFYQFHVGDGFGMLTCVLLVSLFLSDLSYRCLERPVRRIGRRLADRAANPGRLGGAPPPLVSLAAAMPQPIRDFER